MTQTFSVATEELLALFELTPDFVCFADRPGYFKNVNPAVVNTLGYSREELFARPINDFIHPEDREATKSRRANLLTGESLVNFQNRYITKKGKIVWLEWTSTYIREKEMVFAIAKNITQRKEAEHAIVQQYEKLRSQASQFKSNVERDKKYVAVELHEELAQLATSVKVDIDWIRTNITASSEGQTRIDHAYHTSNILVDSIRRISFAISPAMLDDLGLLATLDWYCEEFTLMTGIQCVFRGEFDESLLSSEIRLDFFRICQDVLEQVKKMVQTEPITITIIQNTDKVALSIDGINSADVLKHGVMTVNERVDSFGGNLDVQERKITVECKLDNKA